jgi:hypothetical protein
MSMSNSLKDQSLLDWYRHSTRRTYLALHTADPTDAGTGAEVARGATLYVRQRVYNDGVTAPYWVATYDYVRPSDSRNVRATHPNANIEYTEVPAGQTYGTVTHWSSHATPHVDSATLRANSAAVTLGQWIKLDASATNGRLYEVTVAGTLAASPPGSPNTTDQATHVDGTATLRAHTIRMLDYDNVRDAAGATTSIVLGPGSVPRFPASNPIIQRD